MEHVVFFPAHDGSPAFRRVASLEDAVRLVEHLRNVENVSEVSCHALQEVPLAFKAWYRVEVPAADLVDVVEEAAPEAAPEVVVEDAPEVPEVPEVMVEDAPAVAEVPEQPVPAMASNGRRESGGARSLGFFAS